MSNIYDTHFPDSIRESIPTPWQAPVLIWVRLKQDSFIPSIYLDHDFVQWVAESDPSHLNTLNPSYAFFRLLPPELTSSFGRGDAVSISFDTASESVLFLGEGRWDQSPIEEEAPEKEIEKEAPRTSRLIFPPFPGGLWPGLEDFDL